MWGSVLLRRFHHAGANELQQARSGFDLTLDILLVAQSSLDLLLLFGLQVSCVLFDFSGDLLAQLMLLALLCLASLALLLDLAVLRPLHLELLPASRFLLLEHPLLEIVVVLLVAQVRVGALGRDRLCKEFVTDDLGELVLPSPVIVSLVLGSLEELRDEVFVRLRDLHALFLRAQVVRSLAVLLRHSDKLLLLLLCFLFVKSDLLSQLDFHLTALLSLLDPLLFGSFITSLVLGDNLPVDVKASAHVLRSLPCSTLVLCLRPGFDPLDVTEEGFFGSNLLR